MSLLVPRRSSRILLRNREVSGYSGPEPILKFLKVLSLMQVSFGLYPVALTLVWFLDYVVGWQ